MQDFIIAAVIVIIIGVAIIYIRKAKKSGAKCIGCPAGGNCSSHNHSKGDACSCGCAGDKKSESTCNCGCSEEK